MNVLQLRSEFRDNGPGTQPLTIAQELRRRGHDVVFASSGGVMQSRIEDKGFAFVTIPSLAVERRSILDTVASARALRELIRKYNIDVVHAHNAACTSVALVGSLLAMRRVRLVQSVRGLEQRPTHQWRNQIYRILPATLLAVSRFTARELERFGVSPARIAVSYNGVDLSRFHVDIAARNSIRQSLGLKDELVIGHVGAFSGWKGQHLIVDVLSKTEETHPSLHAILVGDGKVRQEVEELARSHGVLDRVHFVGFQKDAAPYYSAFDFYCQPSIQGEMLPNSIIEAMSTGLPWVGSDISGLVELSGDGAAGIVLPPGDVDALAETIVMLANDTAKRKAMGDAARELARSVFSIENVVDTVEMAYGLHTSDEARDSVA